MEIVKPYARLAGALVALVLGSVTGMAAEEPGGKVTDVGVQQQRVQRGFQEFEQKVIQALDEIRQKDPERAARLQAALDWAGEKALAGRMAGAADLLNDNRLVEAGDVQADMLEDLAAMQQLIQEEPSEYERLQKQIAKVRAWRDTTVELAREQWRLMRDSERARDPGQEQKRLMEQIAEVESLLTGQMELRKRTEQAREPGRMDDVVREQQRLEQEARALLATIRSAGGSAAGSSGGQSSGASASGQSSSSPGGAEQPGESGQADQSDQSGQSGQPGQPDQSGQSAQQGQSAQPNQKGESSPASSSGRSSGAGGVAAQAGEPPRPMPVNADGQASNAQAPEAGEELLKLAIQSQMLSTESLAAQQPHAAVTNQTQAIEKLEMTLRELHFELARQQEIDPEKAKAAQDALGDKTAKLFNDMLQTVPRPPGNDPILMAPQAPGGQNENPNSLPGTQPNLDSPYAQPPGSQQQLVGGGARNTAPDFAAGVNMGAGSPPGISHPQALGTTTPGWNSVALTRPMIKQAVQSMLKASKSLATNRLDVAAPLQRQAYKDLAVTAEQLEQWLVDNRDQKRDALRPHLKTMLQDMLARQESETARTAALEAVRQKGAWTNDSQQALEAVVAGEKEVLRIADKANDALAEDGSTIAFRGMMMEARDVLEKVIAMLEGGATGVPVRDLQHEVEQTVARLIKATEENLQTVEAGEGKNFVKPPRQGKPPPLIPLGTELRLLKAQQELINGRTAAIARESAGGLVPEKAEELQRLVRRQAKVHELTKDVIHNLSEWQP